MRNVIIYGLQKEPRQKSIIFVIKTLPKQVSAWGSVFLYTTKQNKK